MKKLLLLIFTGLFLISYADSDEDHMSDCYNCYIKKDNFVYFNDDGYHPVKIKEADYTSFVFLSRFYAKDKKNVYFQKTIIKDADVKTFRIFSDNYAADKNYIYYNGRFIKNSDPDTFEILDDNFVKDKNHIYLRGNIADDDYKLIKKK